MKTILLLTIRGYQKISSAYAYFIKMIFATNAGCRFHPTCSDYTYEAVEKYGVQKGGVMGVKRILRCHPWAKGGVDEVL